MKQFLCFVLVMLMCLGGQALATPQWQNAEPVKAEDQMCIRDRAWVVMP